jgi:uncharacterized protein (DUF2141 family)
MKLALIRVPSSEGRSDFEDIPPGSYALYSFSKDAKVAFKAPSFQQGSVVYDGTTLDLTIALRY